MNFFDYFFGDNKQQDPPPSIKFGRYTDAYKLGKQYDAWDKSLEKFENDEYLPSYILFLQYLRDDRENNVRWEEINNVIHFEILQGSKIIKGTADNKKVKIFTKVAVTDALNVGFMRRLIEINFDLKYGRYALDDDDDIVMVFDTYTLDGSPYKLYYALKELAISSDKQDDLLIDEFEILHTSDTGTILSIDESEKEAKYNFITEKVTGVFEAIDKGSLNTDQYPGGIAYLLLNLSYKLDYLVKPEGYMMEALERMHRLYFAKDNKSTIEKNRVLRKELKKLIDRPKEEFFKEMYNVTSTFGITAPANHDQVIGFIDGELHNMDWYQENGHQAVALAIPGYIIGYCLFNYAVPKPDRDLFQLFYQIVENDFFMKLGFKNEFYNPETKKFDRKAIKKAIERIVENNENTYPKLNPKTNTLNYKSISHFAASFLLMVRNLDMTQAS